MIDTHVHYNVDPLYDNYAHFIEKAMQAGVNHFIVIGFDHETIERAFEIASLYDNVSIACGFHPTIAETLTEEDFDQLEAWCDHEKVVAIGECGIDLHWNKETLEIQKKVFKRQLDLAKKKDLPVVVHMRDATLETLNVAATPKEVAKKVPLDRLLLETDAPFLTPHPYRGKTNSSHYLPLIRDAIASLREISSETLEKETTKNAIQLFNIDM